MTRDNLNLIVLGKEGGVKTYIYSCCYLSDVMKGEGLDGY